MGVSVKSRLEIHQWIFPRNVDTSRPRFVPASERGDAKIARHWGNNAESVIGSGFVRENEDCRPPRRASGSAVFRGWPGFVDTPIPCQLLAIVPSSVNGRNVTEQSLRYIAASRPAKLYARATLERYYAQSIRRAAELESPPEFLHKPEIALGRVPS